MATYWARSAPEGSTVVAPRTKVGMPLTWVGPGKGVDKPLRSGESLDAAHPQLVRIRVRVRVRVCTLFRVRVRVRVRVCTPSWRSIPCAAWISALPG